MSDPVLRLRSISKSYGSGVVLSGVNLEVRAGEVTALLGENGAGKSTLAKIIAGVVRPDGGTVEVSGTPKSFDSPRDAMAAGISFIPQELICVPDLTVAENICLGRPPSRFGFTSRRAMTRRAAREQAEVGFELPLDSAMASIPLMQQQLAVILRALSRRPRVMILDEPTAALEARDSAALLTLVRGLAQQGVALIYISHRLEEVFAHCDTVHVLREGKLVLSGSTSKVTRSAVVQAMVDKDPDDMAILREPVAHSEPALVATGWTKSSHPVLDGVSVQVARGEVVGLYGLRGSGSDTFAEAVAGTVCDAFGTLEIDGLSASVRSPYHARRAGIRYVPADRKSQGLVMGQQIIDNLNLPALSEVSSGGWMQRRKERRRARRLAQETRLRAAHLTQPVSDLSGGNQQKVLLGSRFTDDVKVLVLQEPSRGVDVNARPEIHRLLRSLAARGVAQLVASSDLEELVVLCDRVLVFSAGQIVREVLEPSLSSQAEILHYAGGLQE